jgi:hypothetical protein
MRICLAGLLLIVPIADELIGMREFEALCQLHGVSRADLSRARGKSVKFGYGERKLVSHTLMPIRESDVWLTDAMGGETLAHYKNYYAAGGWLMRYTWLSMGASRAMLFEGNGCGWSVQERRIHSENILVVN